MLKISCKELLSFIKNKTRVFLVVFISLLVVSTSLFYYYYLTKSERMELRKYKYHQRIYHLQFDEGNISRDDKISIIQEIIETNKLPELRTVNAFYNYTEDARISGQLQFDTVPHIIIEGKSFEEKDFKENQNIIIIGLHLIDYSKKLSYVGEEYKINNNKYTIIGVDGLFDKYITLPFSNYIDDGYPIELVKFKYSHRFSQKEINILSDIVEKYQGVTLIKPIPDSRFEFDYMLKLAIAFILAALCLLSISRLFAYWVKLNIRNYLIYIVCGADKRIIHTISVIGLNILIIISCFIGIVMVPAVNVDFSSLALMFPDFIFLVIILIIINTLITQFNIKRIILKLPLELI